MESLTAKDPESRLLAELYLNEESLDKEKWIRIAVILSIFIVGIVGNFLVIFVVISLREYRKIVTHWYVLQLAIADSMFLWILPFRINEMINDEWIFSSLACSIRETILFWNYYASILFLTVMSIDRYLMVCHQVSTKKYRTLSGAIIISVIVWISSFLFCIPIMKYSGKMGIAPYCKCGYHFPSIQVSKEEFCRQEGFIIPEELEFCISSVPNITEKATCSDPIHFIEDFDYGNIGDIVNCDFAYYLNSSFYYDGDVLTKAVSDEEIISASCHYWDKGILWKLLLLFNFVVMFLIPLIIMTICYSQIAVTLRKKNTREIELNKGAKSINQKPNNSKENKRVTTMCAILVTVFIVCWLPFHSIHIAKIVGIVTANNDGKWCIILPSIASLIAYSNSALNPYIYNFLGTKFGVRLRAAATNSFQLRKSRRVEMVAKKSRRNKEKTVSTSFETYYTNGERQI